jgi:hypothetical protein
VEGRVKRVLVYPVDAQRVRLLTVQPHLVDQFLQNEVRIEVDVVLDTDPRTPSGLRWTTEKGPLLRSLCKALSADGHRGRAVRRPT